MKNNPIVLFIVHTAWIIFSFSEVHAQFSTRGKDFWFALMPNLGTGGTCDVSITCDVATSGVISMPGQNWSQSFTILPNSTIQITVPSANNPIIRNNQTVMPNAIHIVAQDPVSVYCLNSLVNSSDASIILPTVVLGNEYYISAYTPLSTNESSMLIVGVEDNSIISITPSVNTFGGNTAGVPFNITLNQGDAYLVQSNRCASIACDLTGTLVSSLINGGNGKKFAVFGGARCTNVPTTCSFCDHLFDQMFPLCTWGSTYILPRLATKSFDVYRILASQNNTSVSINGGPPFLLNAGRFNEQQINVGSVISSDKPISVTQYCTSTSCDGIPSDPFQIVLSPVEQIIDYVVFDAFATASITSYYVNIVTETSNVNNVVLDGVIVPRASFIAVPSSNYSYAQLSISSGSHTIQSAGGILAYTYGFGGADSYGYPAGVNLNSTYTSIFNILMEDSAISYLLFNDTLKCGLNSITVISDTHSSIDSVWWSFGDGTGFFNGDTVTHHYNQTGSYTITYYFTFSGPPFCGTGIDSIQKEIFVEIYNPLAVNQINDTIICKDNPINAIPIVLNGTPPFAYEWNINNVIMATGPTGNFIPPDQGIVKLIVTDNCSYKDSIAFNVNFYVNVDVPMVIDNFILCDKNQLSINNISAMSGKPPYQYKWYYNGIFIYEGIPLTYTPSASGSGMLLAKDDCGSIDTVTFTVAYYPPMAISPLEDVEICRNKPLALEAFVTGGSGEYNYSWRFNSSEIKSNNPIEFVPIENGVYSVQITDICDTGFVDFNITIRECDIIIPGTIIPDITIPNVFTPNNDGKNETFIVENIEYHNNQLTIYNRWGNKIYETFNYTNDWNGGNHSEGVYFYILKLENGEEFKGSLTILK